MTNKKGREFIYWYGYQMCDFTNKTTSSFGCNHICIFDFVVVVDLICELFNVIKVYLFVLSMQNKKASKQRDE